MNDEHPLLSIGFPILFWVVVLWLMGVRCHASDTDVTDEAVSEGWGQASSD